MTTDAFKAIRALHRATPNAPLSDEFLKLAADAQRITLIRWKNLNVIVTRNEARIRSRWKKYTVSKRHELLRSIYKEIPKLHRPEIVEGHWYGPGSERDQFSREIPDVDMLMPYLNIEDLSDPKSILIFLNARARHHPASFAHAEHEFASGGLIVSETELKHPRVKMYIGEGYRDEETDVEIEYGTIQEFSCISTALLSESTTTRCGPYKEPSSLLGDEYTFSSFAEGSRLMPFRARLKPDFARLRHLVSTLLEAAKEHLWALREDPTYFAEHIEAYMDHCHEHILNDKGEPDLSGWRKQALHHNLSDMIQFSNYNLIMWTQIHEDFIKLESLSSSVEGKADQRLPKSYCQAIEVVYHFLRYQKDHLSSMMNVCLWGSPPLRHLHKRINTTAEDFRITAIESEDRIGSHIRQFMYDLSTGNRSIRDLHFRLDYLETFQQRHPTARQKISPLIEQMLTPLSICVHCIVELKIAACNSRLATRFERLEKYDLEPQYMTKFQSSINNWLGRNEPKMDSIVAPSLGNPADGKFYYPEDDAESKPTVDARRKAELNLDRFWRYVDNASRKITGASQHATVQKFFLESGPMQRTAPWQGPTEPTKNTHRNSHEYHPLSEVYHDTSKEITGNFDRLAIGSSSNSNNKGKEKTRGTAAPTEDVAQQAPQPAEATTEKPIFRVDKNSMVVFRMLFPSQNVGELRRSIRWAEFVNALTKLGFSAEQLHGSAWQFSPKTLQLERGIQFHMPHPEGEVSLQLARRFGRRLNRAYGWDASTFRRK
ncbi:hypothetical protein GQ44DRAFT_726042 [Phaeosphaeriaceae sp. PMI808]|nr:hypothetical protein GQ44DRAFT_726042 [Phaeosphaeriaceae sp. PMI808]